jgi:hypothetical protein
MSANVTSTVPDKFASGYENQSGLHALLEAVCAELRLQPLIAAKELRVLPEYHADLFNQLNAVLNKKLSVLISVGFAQVDADHDSLSTMLRRVTLEIDVFENVLINQAATGTKTSALSYAEACLSALHQWQPTATETLVNPGALRMAKSGTLTLNKDKSELKSGLVCYTTRFLTSQCLACHCAED